MAAGLLTRLWVLSKSAPRAPMTGTEMLYLWRSRRRMASSASYRQPSLEEGRLDGHGHATARRDEDHEHLVLVDQLLGRGDARGLLARIVGGDDLELPAVDTALAVDVAEVGHRPVVERTEARGLPRVRPQVSDLDGGIGDPLRVVRPRRGRAHDQAQQGKSQCEEERRPGLHV